MRDKHDSLVQQFLQAQKLVLHLPPDEGVESAEGFVQKPEFWLNYQASGDAHTLLLPA